MRDQLRVRFEKLTITITRRTRVRRLWKRSKEIGREQQGARKVSVLVVGPAM